MTRSDPKLIATEFEPEAARIRADAARQLDAIQNPTEPPPGPRQRGPRTIGPTDDTSRLIAKRIRALRTERGWSLAEFAFRVSEVAENWLPSGTQMSKIETSQRAVSVPELAAICLVLDVRLPDIARAGRICPTCEQEIPE